MFLLTKFIINVPVLGYAGDSSIQRFCCWFICCTQILETHHSDNTWPYKLYHPLYIYMILYVDMSICDSFSFHHMVSMVSISGEDRDLPYFPMCRWGHMIFNVTSSYFPTIYGSLAERHQMIVSFHKCTSQKRVCMAYILVYTVHAMIYGAVLTIFLPSVQFCQMCLVSFFKMLLAINGNMEVNEDHGETSVNFWHGFFWAIHWGCTKNLFLGKLTP